MSRPLLLATAVLALLVSGCGSGPQAGADGTPTPSHLAAGAFAALEEAGSAHYVISVEARGNADGANRFALDAEGDVSAKALTADGSVSFGGVSFDGQVLATRQELFVGFMGQWYGDRKFSPFDMDDLASADEIQEYFDRVFTGSVSAGPEVDGAATWRFEGKLNADGFADLTEKFDQEDVTERERELLRVVAEKTRFVLDVGRDDRLPRRLEFQLELSSEDVAEIGDGLDSGGFEDLVEFDVSATLELSDFGKEVTYEPPADYRPLDELFGQLFGGLE